ncbi:MAG: hypothetical protein V6Z86_02775 [Hyphomicrobiales bacterium]
MIQKAKTLVGQREKRAEFYRQAREIFKARALWATIAHSTTSVPMRENVTGCAHDPFDKHCFEGVDLALW